MFLKELKREGTTSVTVELTADEIKVIDNVLHRCCRNGDPFTDEQKYFIWKFGAIRDLVFHGQVDNLFVQSYKRMFESVEDSDKKSKMPSEIENPRRRIIPCDINPVNTEKYEAFKKRHSITQSKAENIRTDRG